MAGHDDHGGSGGGAHGGGGHDKEHKAHKKHGPHPPHEEHEEPAEWIVSFADNALLQMGFFVILLALNLKPAAGSGGGPPQPAEASASSSAAPSSALLDGAIAIREAFNNPINMNSTNPNDLPLIRRVIQRKEGDSKVDGAPGDKKNVESVRPTDYHRIGGVVMFDERSSKIGQAGEEAMAELSKDLRGRKTIIEIRGHTSLSESTQPGDRGMRLSFDRALAVAGLLKSGGLEWDQLRVVAVGPADRAAPIARTAGDRQINQRVEVVITDEAMPSDPYAQDPSRAPTPTASAPAGE